MFTRTQGNISFENKVNQHNRLHVFFTYPDVNGFFSCVLSKFWVFQRVEPKYCFLTILRRFWVRFQIRFRSNLSLQKITFLKIGTVDGLEIADLLNKVFKGKVEENRVQFEFSVILKFIYHIDLTIPTTLTVIIEDKWLIRTMPRGGYHGYVKIMYYEYFVRIKNLLNNLFLRNSQ